MNSIQQIRRTVEKRFPAASLNVEEPVTAAGSWWLDVYLDGQHVVVEWRPAEGFGVSTPADDDYGEGADEVYATIAEASDRVRGLLESGTRTNGEAGFPASLLRR
jgi:hypothetical protein